MAEAILVPKATITLEEAFILGWKKSEGSQVHKDEVLFEMETDKVVVEVPSPADGFLLRIVVTEGPAKVEQVVGWIGALCEVIDLPAPAADSGAAAGDSSQGVPSTSERHQGTATPAARRRAKELGVDLAAVFGTGPGGRVTEKDVEAVVIPKGDK